MVTSVSLTSHFERFIEDQIASGRYNNASEVMRAGLRLLEKQEQEHQAKLEQLRADINVGFESGEGRPADEVFDRLKNRLRNRNR